MNEIIEVIIIVSKLTIIGTFFGFIISDMGFNPITIIRKYLFKLIDFFTLRKIKKIKKKYDKDMP